ncbi:MAG: hypothetical protein ABFD54_15630 [Armatimonadota bacterium]|nr:hypothetical protein [bacterium]
MRRFIMGAVYAIALICAFGMCSQANAARYKLTLINTDEHPLPSVIGTLWIDKLGSYQRVYAGPIWLNVLDTQTNQSEVVRMLCVDLAAEISVNQTWEADISYARPSTVASDSAWDKAVWMAVNNSGWYSPSGWPTGDPATQDAAVQLSVWEVIADGSTNFSMESGSFNVSPNPFEGANREEVLQIAQGYFNSANPPQGYGSSYAWYDATSSGQDLLFIPTVPEIPAVALGSIGLSLLACWRSRRRK